MTSARNERLVSPLARRRTSATWPRAIGGAMLLVAAYALAAHRYDLHVIGSWVLPLVAFVAGTALVWSPLDAAAIEDLRRPEAVIALFSREHWPRVLVGLALAGVGIMWFARWEFTDQPILRVIVMPLAVLLALALLFAPWLLRLVRQARLERSQRIREFERAEIAAHLHDSVLQTLTLIRRQADDPAAVARLARAQERDLRAYLYHDRRTPEESVATALAGAVSAVEDAHGVAIESVSVGDAPTDRRMRAAVAAAKEAASNAAKHGMEPISVYAEVTPEVYEVFVRDSGPGFNPKRIPADRLGIRESIMGRVERHGGSATVTSRRGEATEVHISVPRNPEGKAER